MSKEAIKITIKILAIILLSVALYFLVNTFDVSIDPMSDKSDSSNNFQNYENLEPTNTQPKQIFGEKNPAGEDVLDVQGIMGRLSQVTYSGVYRVGLEEINGEPKKPVDNSPATKFLANTQINVRQLPAGSENIDDINYILSLPVIKTTTTDLNGFFKIEMEPGAYFVTVNGQEDFTGPGRPPFSSAQVTAGVFSNIDLVWTVVMQ